MKIIQLIQKPQLRGAEMFASQLGNHLVANNCEVLLVSIFKGEAVLPFTGRHIPLARGLRSRLFDFYGWLLLYKIIKSEKPDIIQANAGDTLKFAVFSKFIFWWKAPIVYRNANQMSAFIDSRLKYWFYKLLISRVSHTVSVSNLCQNDFIGLFKAPQQKVSMIPIGIETQSVSSDVPPDLIQVFKEGPIWVNVASLVPEKNHQGLIEIFEKFKKQNQPGKLLLIGDGKLRSQLKEIISNSSCSQHILLLGSRIDALVIIQHSKALLLPSKIEGLPGVILESFFLRTPVIAYDVGGISEVVINAKTGWLVKPNDEVAFMSAMKEVISGRNVEAITQNAHGMVTENFSNETIAARFLAVYNKMIREEKN